MERTAEQTHSFTPVIEQAMEQLHTVTAPELLIAIALPVLAIFLGRRIATYLSRLQSTGWHARLANFIAPLLLPGLALLFTAIAIAIFKALDVTPVLLPFAIKVMVAWMAMRAIILLDPGQLANWFIALAIIPATLLHLLGLWDPLVAVMEGVSFSFGTIDLNLFTIMKTLAVLIALFWVAGFMTRTIDRRLRKTRGMHASSRALILKIFQIALYFVIFLILLQTMGIDISALSFFGGAFGVALGLGFQKIASNFVSGIIMLFEKSVEIGDVVELADGTAGMVCRTSARYTLIELIDGREVLIPNEEFISQRVTNWTHSNTRGRAEIIVQISFHADVEKARIMMLEAASAHPKCLATPKPTCVLSRFPDGNVELTLYFWIADMTEGRLEPRSEISIAIWKAFRTAGIQAAAPQRMILEAK